MRRGTSERIPIWVEHVWSVRLSVTPYCFIMFLSSYHQVLNFQDSLPLTKVMPMQKVKVTCQRSRSQWSKQILPELFTQSFIQAQIRENIKAPVTGLWARNSPGTGEFPAQMASNAENVSIWWRHRGMPAAPPMPTHRILKIELNLTLSHDTEGLAQNYRISSVDALQILQSFIKSSYDCLSIFSLQARRQIITLAFIFAALTVATLRVRRCDIRLMIYETHEHALQVKPNVSQNGVLAPGASTVSTQRKYIDRSVMSERSFG